MSQQPPAGYYPTYNPYPAPQQVPVGAPGWAPPAHPQTYQGYTAPQPYPQQAQQYPQTQPQPPFNYQNPSYPAPQNTGYPPTFPQQFPGSQPWPQGAQPGQQWQQGGSQGQPPWNPAYNQQQVQPTAPQGPYPPQPSQPYPQQPVAPNNFPYNNFGQPPTTSQGYYPNVPSGQGSFNAGTSTSAGQGYQQPGWNQQSPTYPATGYTQSMAQPSTTAAVQTDAQNRRAAAVNPEIPQDDFSNYAQPLIDQGQAVGTVPNSGPHSQASYSGSQPNPSDYSSYGGGKAEGRNKF